MPDQVTVKVTFTSSSSRIFGNHRLCDLENAIEDFKNFRVKVVLGIRSPRNESWERQRRCGVDQGLLQSQGIFADSRRSHSQTATVS